MGIIWADPITGKVETMMQPINTPDLDSYDTIIVAFSGGKDSLACALTLLENGADKSKMELWHHDIDGREDDEHFMDWPVTADYCRAVGKALGIPVYFSWKMGGYKREMLRENSKTAPTKFETPDGEIIRVGGTRGKDSTRRKFPQVSADLKVRWCSAYLKIDPCAAAIRNQSRFDGKRTLVVSGERAEESASRANYKTFEPDRSDNRDGKKARHVDRYRPVHQWEETKVWEIIERWKINPHPAYRLGWGRLSCMTCIFGSDNQWASVNAIAPEKIQEIANYENEFGFTIHRTKSVGQRANEGTPYPNMKTETIKEAMRKEFTGQIIIENWAQPAGAFGESCGPS
jgi:3'-phosphoadenosine 5'-phosphosulfate sulfotransferase (PAPS reductase)/FAD synthetase